MAPKESLTMQPPPPEDLNGGKPLVVRRGRVGSVELYEIKDSELETLAGGSPATLELTFGVALVSIAFTSLGTIVSTTFKNDTLKSIFILVTIIGFVLGIYFLLVWYRSKSSINVLVQTIKDRMPPYEKIPPPVSQKTGDNPSATDKPVG